MKCPHCGSETKVIDKRISSDSETNRRRRECMKCGQRFTTYERLEFDAISKIRKRDGKLVDFNKDKITQAIFKSAEAVGGKDRHEAERLSGLVFEYISKKFKGKIPTVEDVSDTVEKVLIEEGHAKTAKTYILYRDQHKKLRENKAVLVNVQNTIKNYMDRLDWQVKENSNEAFSFSGLLLYTAGEVMKNYNLTEMYTPEIANAHKKGYAHIHDLSHGVIGYCAGWSLKNLIMLGFGGVPNKVDCRPAKHMNTLVHQMVNYIGCLQMEFAGAQAFSSVDTLLAPFVRTDKLSYKQIKQCMQQLVFSLNIPSRWGCVTPDTEILTLNGWKRYDEVKEGETIWSLNLKTRKIGKDEIKKINIYDFDGDLIKLSNRSQEQLLTPNHRVVRVKYNSEELVVSKAEELLDFSSPIYFPVARENINENFDISDEELKLYPWIISEGTIDSGERVGRERIIISQSPKINKEYCNEIESILSNLNTPFSSAFIKSGWGDGVNRYRLGRAVSRELVKIISKTELPMSILRKCSPRQIKLFINEYIKGDGSKERPRIYTKDKQIKDDFQELCAICGYGSGTYLNKNGIFVINMHKNQNQSITKKEKVKYKGKVWCPTTSTSTWIARRNGNVFITGNSQYPFSNLTFDWTVPADMKDQPAIVGGKEQDFTYGDCQKEMDILNKAFLEVMIEGDANGRIFSFPIPTYNLTKDFEWDSPNVKLLFELTAKYGTPYFQNYIGSNLDPSSIRAMCLRPEEEIVVKIDSCIKRTKIGELCENYSNGFDDEGWCDNNKDIYAVGIDKDFKTKWIPVRRFLKTTGNATTTIKTKDGKRIEVSSNHPIPVATKDGIKIKPAGEVENNDYMLMLRSADRITSNTYKKIGKYEIDEKFAKLLGLFISEGNFLYDSRKPYRNINTIKGLQFSFNGNEAKLIEELVVLLKNITKKEPKIIKDKRYNTICVILYDYKFSMLLYKNGIHKYGNLPDIIFDCPSSVIKTFLDYHFLGDGYKRGKEIHINDEKLSRDLAILYSLIGVPVTYRKRKNSQVIRIQHNLGRGSNKKVIRGILYNRLPNFLIDGNCVGTARRQQFLNRYESVSLTSLNRFGGLTELNAKYLLNDVTLVKIDNVKHEIYEKPKLFYDIELEGEDHFFVHSLGAVTHNCCRLNLNQRELMNRPGGMWGPGDSTGSIGVMTLNMNRLGYEAKDKKDFFEKLKYYMVLSKNALEIKRKVVERNLKNGLMPFTKRYLGTFNNHFSTIGLCGMHECCMNFLGKGIQTKEGKDFTVEVLKFMRNEIKKFQQETGSLFNLEATPAESTSYRLARLDKEMYSDIYTSGDKEPYLTNSTQLPVDFTDDAIEAIEHQNEIQPLYTGGTIFHTFLGERMIDGEACKRLVKKIAYNTRMPYFSITPTFSICKKHGYLKGEQFKCPTCGEETEVYSRIVGYYRPVQNWNAGKVEEFKDRLEFSERKTTKHEFKTKIEKSLEHQEKISVEI